MKLPQEAELHGHYLEWLCVQGWDNREISRRAERLADLYGISFEEQVDVYVARLARELDALKSQKFVDYTLIVYDLINWCRESGIMVGPGRGSSAGSLIYFLIGITAVDPIEHKLLFERFISPDRQDMPDADLDFEDTRREEVTEYLKRKYGDENVAQIATVMALKGKSCIKDISRVWEVPYEEVNKITSAIITRPAGDERTFNTIEEYLRKDVQNRVRQPHEPMTERLQASRPSERTQERDPAGIERERARKQKEKEAEQDPQGRQNNAPSAAKQGRYTNAFQDRERMGRAAKAGRRPNFSKASGQRQAKQQEASREAGRSQGGAGMGGRGWER